MVERFGRAPVGQPVLLNINVPDLAEAELGDIEVTRLGRRHKAEPVVKMQTPRGETGYWIGAAGDAQDAGPGTDFHAVAAGPAQDAGPGTDFHAVAGDRVSVTPLQMDLTHQQQISTLKSWLAK